MAAMNKESQSLSSDELRSRVILTVHQAAELIGIGRNTLYERINAGEIPVIRVGRRILIPTARLLEKFDLGEPSVPTLSAPSEPMTLRQYDLALVIRAMLEAADQELHRQRDAFRS